MKDLKPKTKYRLIFLDTETTGLSKEDRLCQLAYTYDNIVVNELFNPGRPIDIGAMSIHHITEDMVKDKQDFKDSVHYLTLQSLLNDDENSIFVAHNAQFDIGMVEREGITVPRHICTKKIAQYLNADNPNISKANLQYLRYYYGIDMEATAHDALGDILILREVFYKLVETALKKSKSKNPSMDKVIERMMEITMKPQMIKKMPFGKYKGYEMETVYKAEPTYLKWIVESGKFDEDKSLIYTCKKLLGIES